MRCGSSGTGFSVSIELSTELYDEGQGQASSASGTATTDDRGRDTTGSRRLRMPLEIAFVPGRHTECQAIGDLSRDFFGDAGSWAATVMALHGPGERIGGDAAELNGSNFNAPPTDFNRAHFELPRKKSRLVGGFVSSKR
jgi:hypothetical protein